MLEHISEASTNVEITQNLLSVAAEIADGVDNLATGKNSNRVSAGLNNSYAALEAKFNSLLGFGDTEEENLKTNAKKTRGRYAYKRTNRH